MRREHHGCSLDILTAVAVFVERGAAAEDYDRGLRVLRRELRLFVGCAERLVDVEGEDWRAHYVHRGGEDAERACEEGLARLAHRERGDDEYRYDEAPGGDDQRTC